MSIESNPVAQTIVVSAIEPNQPLVLCNPQFLHTLSQVEREVAGVAIADGSSAQSAANLLTRLTTAASALEKARTTLKAPFIAKGKEIDDAARAPSTRIEAAKRVINSKLVAWQQEQAKRAREAEVARLAEIRRLEELRAAEAIAAFNKAEELAAQAREAAKKAKAPVVDLDWDEEVATPPAKTDTELALEAAKHTPAVVEEKPAGITYRVRLIHRVVDVNKLPDMFVVKTANDGAIRSTFCTKWEEGQPLPVVDGVEFRVDKMPVSMGRSVF